MDRVGEERGDEDVHAVLVEMVQEVRLLALVHARYSRRESLEGGGREGVTGGYVVGGGMGGCKGDTGMMEGVRVV
jgi:hypothetical protein